MDTSKTICFIKPSNAAISFHMNFYLVAPWNSYYCSHNHFNTNLQVQ